MLQSRIGERFDGIVTGRSVTDAWVRIFSPPVEGKLVTHTMRIDVGQALQVKPVGVGVGVDVDVDVDVERGFVDLVQAL